jgi:hypothetical protein
MSNTALSALRIFADWLAVDVQELQIQAITRWNFIRSSTADEQEMMAACLQYCFGQNARTIQLPVRIWRAGCDPERVSTLIRLIGYDNLIRIDNNWVSISIDGTVNYSTLGNSKILRTLGYLQKISVVVQSVTDMRLCAQLMNTQQLLNIFRASFYTDHAMVSAILRGLSTLPFHVSSDTPGLQDIDFRVNFVRVAWLIEARGYSVYYQSDDQGCTVDASGTFPACSTWTDRRSIMQNMPMFYKCSVADH